MKKDELLILRTINYVSYMNEHLCWAAAMLGNGMVTKLQEMLFLPSRNCTGKWDRKYMRTEELKDF